MTNIIHPTEAGFEADVLRSPQPVVVDFYATWCPPCRVIAPILDDLSGEFSGRVRVAKVNVDDAPQLAQEYRVQGVPTLVFFRDGQEVDRLVGAASADVLRARMNALSGPAVASR